MTLKGAGDPHAVALQFMVDEVKKRGFARQALRAILTVTADLGPPFQCIYCQKRLPEFEDACDCGAAGREVVPVCGPEPDHGRAPAWEAESLERK